MRFWTKWHKIPRIPTIRLSIKRSWRKQKAKKNFSLANKITVSLDCLFVKKKLVVSEKISMVEILQNWLHVIIIYLLFVCVSVYVVCMCVYVHTTICICRSEGNLLESVLPFSYMGSKGCTQVLGFVANSFIHWAAFLAPNFVICIIVKLVILLNIFMFYMMN